MALANVSYFSTSYLFGALFIVLGVLLPLAHMMRKSRRQVFRFRRD
jgi:hypothetical protein